MMPITEEVRALLTANAAAQIQRDDEYLGQKEQGLEEQENG